MNNRLSPEYVLLGFLYLQPSHGYELNKKLEDELGLIWRVSQSQTYNILKRLEAQGYIRSTTVGQEKLPPRQLLHLTKSGSDRFITWLETPTRCSVHAIRVEFITRLYFIQQLYPSKTQDIIQAQLDEVQAGYKRLQEVSVSFGDVQRFNRLALEMRISVLNSIIGWLNFCRSAFPPDNPGA